jgi:flavin reductase (DIM6/NTAB) family NADH-FMN oxidoreductase RutF
METSGGEPEEAPAKLRAEQPGDTAPERAVIEDDIAQLLQEHKERSSPERTQHSVRDKMQEDLKESVRTVFRWVPRPVVVLTAAAKNPQGQPIPLGIAVSSFTTVTLNPPMVSFNIKHPSSTLDAIRADNGRFRVHLLPSQTEAANIADSFTRGNYYAAFVDRQKYMYQPPEVGQKMNGPAEILPRYVTAAMQCELVQEVQVADHVIVVAKVSSMSSHHDGELALLYADGKYLTRNLSKTLGLADRKYTKPLAPKSSFSLGSHPLWSVPLFADEQVKVKYGKYLQDSIRDHPELLNLPLPEAERQIAGLLDVAPDALGWCIQGLVEEVAAQAMLKATGEQQELKLPKRYDFYGSLAPEDVAAIIDRAKQLVRVDPRVLSLVYTDFLRLLGVSRGPSGLLTGDILEALRREELASPFDPHKAIPQSSLTIEDLERVEFRLLQFFNDTGRSAILHMSVGDLCREITGFSRGEIRGWLQHVRDQLETKAFPQDFGESEMDFVGGLAIEEARIATHRIIALSQDLPKWARGTSKEAPWLILRQCRIHPLVSGFDPYFLITRLKRCKHGLPNARDYLSLVRSLYDSYFKGTVKWDDLEHAVETLVARLPMRAITLSREELLVAMRLRPEATTTPKGQSALHRLLETNHVPMLLCWALKKHHSTFSAEEREAVDVFLFQNDTMAQRRWMALPRQRVSNFEKYQNPVTIESKFENLGEASQPTDRNRMLVRLKNLERHRRRLDPSIYHLQPAKDISYA